VSTALCLAPLSPATANGGYGGHGGSSTPSCPDSSGNRGSTVNIFKPVNVNKTINIFKPVVIDKNININKNVIINKNVVINKVDAIAAAQANAFTAANAAVQAGGTAQNVVYAGSYQIINYTSRAGGAIAIAATAGGGACHVQDATVIKAIHAVCVAFDGREFPASHMTGDTWIDSGYEGEVARCIPGAHLKITIGDVVQSDQGLAGSYDRGQILQCGAREALRHFKDGMVKCVAAIPVRDCTERTNLRRWGTGDFFFSFRGKVCVTQSHSAEVGTAAEAEVSGMTLEGGVGDRSGD
jgi:hypothetical protein